MIDYNLMPPKKETKQVEIKKETKVEINKELPKRVCQFCKKIIPVMNPMCCQKNRFFH